MATKLQTYTTPSDAGNNRLTNENAEFYQRTLLDALYNQVVFMPYGKKKPIPKNAGATTSFRILEMPAVASTAVTEGITPDGIDLTVNKVSATVQQFGTWTKITDLLDMTGLDPLITEVSSMFGEHAGLSMDIVIRDILLAGTNAQFANSRATRALLQAGDVLTTAEIQKARATMVKNNVKMMKLPNGNKGYIAFIHPDTATTIFNLQEWKDQNTYVDVKNREAGIVGQMYGIYFIEANTAGTFTNGGAGGNLAGKSILIIGEDAFGIPDIAGSSKPEIMVFTEGSTENPMGLYSTVAWKSTFTALRLQELKILRLEVLNV
ncbi:MAG TPA: N4-gp56 family major capsid protein [Fusibacter sp.]|nr:N4-gp56 family major capsid protein [Fusibacter sp.]